MSRSIIAMASLVTAICVFLIGQWWWHRKELSYSASITELLTIHGDVAERVEILFDGLPEKSVALALFTLTNSGHEAIRSTDFERSLRIDCGDGSRLLTVEVIATTPPNLKPQVDWTTGARELALQPLLLNKKDKLTIKALVSGIGPAIVDARIAGVRINHTTMIPAEVAGASSMLLIVLILMFCTAASVVSAIRRGWTDVKTICFCAMAIFAASMIVSLSTIHIKKHHQIYPEKPQV